MKYQVFGNTNYSPLRPNKAKPALKNFRKNYMSYEIAGCCLRLVLPDKYRNCSMRAMANMTTCRDCGHAVSRQAKSCPKCGREFRNPAESTVKAVFGVLGGIVLAVIALGAMRGCGG